MDTRFWLLMSIAGTATLWIPYVLHRFVRLGVSRTLGNPRVADLEALSPWAVRAQRAHANAVENLVIFAPLALLALERGLGNCTLVSGAAATYFFARLAHYVLYAAGVPGLRTLAFLAGFGAQLTVALALAGGAQ